MAIKVTSRSEITVQKLLSLGPNSQDRVNDTSHHVKLKFQAKSAVPMSKHSHFALPLADGSATIDLLNLPNKVGPSPVTTGLRVQILKVTNPNPTKLTVQAAGPGGYPLSFDVPPQGLVHIECDNLMPQVEANCHLVAVSGVGTQTSNWMIVLG
jgi:hypothetical protein